MNSYFAWFGLSGTLVLTSLLSLTAIALAALFRTRDRLLCAAGMLFCSGGDIVLGGLFGITDIMPDTYFFLGAGLFIIGHLFYIAAYRSLIGSSSFSLCNRGFYGGVVFTALVFAALTVYMLASETFPGAAMYGICLAYAVIIGGDLSVIWSYAYSRRGIRFLSALAVLVFFVSDLIIGMGKLCDIHQFDSLIWWLYPIGQLGVIIFA